ncbi:MAG: DUF5702 domain-containing protein [Oscillospiraceae bacterium]|nr:DUF5702 domain-containing protein [Oscillospiraceae bacterium]
MKKIFRDTRGAVTVFITLLLIPAMLVSGTAVDLARIHTAQGTLQNANQLAANTLLTQYKALLYDIYGLMGIAVEDPILWKLLEEYIEVTVFGEASQDRGIGTLQVFYGSNVSMEDVYFPDGKHLRNEDVLRRQIEEYMKYRGPVLLVQEFIEKLSTNSIKADAELIGAKMEIDSALADMFEKYRQLYDAIVAADKCTQAVGGIAGGHFGNMSSILNQMFEEFRNMARLAEQYSYAEDWERAELLRVFQGRKRNISSLAVGGPMMGYTGGVWGTAGNINVGLDKAIMNSKQQADDFKPKFDLVVKLAAEADKMTVSLKQKLDEFEKKLAAGEISDEMREVFTKPQGTPPKSIIQRYRDIIKWNIEPMAVAFRDGGYDYIDQIHKPMLDTVKYRNEFNEGTTAILLSGLAGLPQNESFSIGNASFIGRFSSFPQGNVTYKMAPGFRKFAEFPGGNAEFFAELEAMMKQPKIPPVKLFEGQEDAEGKSPEEQQRNLINELLKLVDSAYRGLKNEPLGAMYINNQTGVAASDTDIMNVGRLIPEATKVPALSIINNPLSALGQMGDYILLLTYGSNMFSNYASGKPRSLGKSKAELTAADFDKTLSGVPMSPEVNYFYQSELEYLFNGSENASENLNSVTRLLLLVRLVCNYIRVFSVPEVNAVVEGIRAAFAWAPPLAIVLSELARAAFVAAESVVDVAALRSGHKVPLLKNPAAGQWVCTPSGVLMAAGNVARKQTVDANRFNAEKGLSYVNYMMFFFLANAVFHSGKGGGPSNELATRIGNLIEWNLVNYESRSNADEAAMAQAFARVDRFRLKDMKTDFSITTTADLRMLFLSMAFARDFSNSRGIGVPPSMPIRATDYRGY